MLCKRLAAGLLVFTALLPWHCEARTNAPKDWTVKSADFLDGKIVIVLRGGTTFNLPLKGGICSFDDIQIAPDGITVGWVEGSTAEDPRDPPCKPGAQYVATGPVVWRKGRIMRSFDNWGGALSWSFYGKGDLVAIHSGPRHFDDLQASELRNVLSGRLVKSWSTAEKTRPPDWAAKIVDDTN